MSTLSPECEHSLTQSICAILRTDADNYVVTARETLACLQRQFDAADAPGPELLRARAAIDAARQRYTDAKSDLSEIKRKQRFGLVGRNSAQAHLLSKLCDDYHAEWRHARATEKKLRARMQATAKSERAALRPRLTAQRRRLTAATSNREKLLKQKAVDHGRRLLALREEHMKQQRVVIAEAIDAVDRLAYHYTQVSNFTRGRSLPFHCWLWKDREMTEWLCGGMFNSWFWKQVQSIRDHPIVSQVSNTDCDSGD